MNNTLSLLKFRCCATWCCIPVLNKKSAIRQDKKYTCLASLPDLRIAPDLNFFLFFIFVKYNFSGVNKCVFKYACAQDRPFSFPYPSNYAWHFCALYWRRNFPFRKRSLPFGTVVAIFETVVAIHNCRCHFNPRE